MAQYIKNANIFGRVGSGIGQGLAEQIPKEIERNRLASGLQNLSSQQNLSPFQQFAGLVGVPGAADRPQVIQTAGELLRQQAILNSVNNPQQQQISQPQRINNFDQLRPDRASATTTGSTEAALNPYIPPSGPEQETLARQLMASEPQVYPNIESARQAVASQVASNAQQSQAKLAKRELEESVQNRSEQKLVEELSTLGAEIPGTVMSNLKQKAVDDVRTKKLSPDEAKVKYGKEADAISRSFSNIRSWGGLGLINHNIHDLLQSMRSLQQDAKKGGYQKEAADALISENKLTPEFAYASMYPVKDIKTLNDELKDLENIQPRLEKNLGSPGLAGVGLSRPKNANAQKLTEEVSPRLARSMGTEGSPLAISYELGKKGYDPEVWKQYLLDNQDSLNLTSHQKDELQKPKPGFFGALNDWWLKSFSGVK